MKALLLSALLACGLSAAGQTIPAKANTVLVQTPDSANAALRKLATILVAKGYVVERFDREFHTVAFAPKVVAHHDSPTLIVHASATDEANSTVRMSGEYKAHLIGTPVVGTATYTGYESSLSVACFRQLQSAALAYPLGKVSYSRQ